MGDIIRFGVSVDKTLIEPFDQLIRNQGYGNRSEAIRDLIRNRLVQEEALMNEEIIATVTLVYSHHVRELDDTLTSLQHEAYKRIISTLHVHLDSENCFEVLIIRGRGREVRQIADRLRSVRGVKHCTLSMSTTGKSIS